MVWELINTPPFLVLFIFSFSRLFFLMLYIFRPSVEPGEGACVPIIPLATQLNPMVISLSGGQVA